MKCSFQNADHLLGAITLVAEDIGICIADEEEAQLHIKVQTAETDIVSTALNGNTAEITYGGGIPRFLRGLAMLVSWYKEGTEKKIVTETPLFCTNGAMVDMSRNAVMTVSTVRFMMRKMALMGLNMFMLYTEDTYEVENRPYFGYMRGRYTAEEIREMDRYASALGMELIPCVQMLGHLATALRWNASGEYKDTQNALLVGADATYSFLEDLICTISENFTSRRIHIGMDETHDLGTGRFLDLNGYRERSELYFAHLDRIVKMVESYGLRPMMWSDMFFRLAGKDLPGYGDYDLRVVIPEDLREKVPASVQQVFWDYYRPSEAFYADTIDKHRQFTDDVLFAGGVWGWSGPCMLFSRSLRNTIPALEACKKKGIREVIATVWHNGAEANLILSLAGLAWYADFDYTGRYDEDSVRRCFRYAVGESYDAFLQTEQPEFLADSEYPVTRALLYNDPLTGLIDRHIRDIDTGAYYCGLSETMKGLAPADPFFRPAFDVILHLVSLLENKADFGVRLKTAYDSGDREELAALAEECGIIKEKLERLIESHRRAWMTYNKPFGWEVHDIRYGGLLARFATAGMRIKAYLNGDIDALGELEAERLRFDCLGEGASPFGGAFLWQRYTQMATANILT
ncbi:MAG: beta-N-acetylhexosaminidase [Clostridia bacterium]|nr:beta-N-acetylhexosaminidase [Clostridia bacterium]